MTDLTLKEKQRRSSRRGALDSKQGLGFLDDWVGHFLGRRRVRHYTFSKFDVNVGG